MTEQLEGCFHAARLTPALWNPVPVASVVKWFDGPGPSLMIIAKDIFYNGAGYRRESCEYGTERRIAAHLVNTYPIGDRSHTARKFVAGLGTGKKVHTLNRHQAKMVPLAEAIVINHKGRCLACIFASGIKKCLEVFVLSFQRIHLFHFSEEISQNDFRNPSLVRMLRLPRCGIVIRSINTLNICCVFSETALKHIGNSAISIVGDRLGQS